MKNKIAIILLTCFFLVGCDSFKIDKKIMIDYRHIEAHQEIHGKGDDTTYSYYPESYQIQYEIIYMDGHTRRQWEDCTRFEYQDAINELGGEP